MLVARYALCTRTSGGRSAGVAMITARRRVSAVRYCVTKSCTSRPRSPIRPTTITSAFVNRVIMPSSTLLPTPLPAKRPNRWPRPTVSSALIERTPTSSGSRIGRRSSGFVVRGVSRDAIVAAQRARAVQRIARAVEHAAEQARPRARFEHAATSESRARPASRRRARRSRRAAASRRKSRRPRSRPCGRRGRRRGSGCRPAPRTPTPRASCPPRAAARRARRIHASDADTSAAPGCS